MTIVARVRREEPTRVASRRSLAGDIPVMRWNIAMNADAL